MLASVRAPSASPFINSFARLALLVSLLAVTVAAPARALGSEELVALESASLHAAWLVPTDAPRTTVTLVVLAGERDNRDEPGLPHYAEHLVWLSAIDARARGGGRHTNASTSLASTSYWLDGPAEELDDLLAAIARVFAPIELPDAFAREEIGIVQREYDLRVRESPDRRLWDELARLQHGDRWPARSVIGTPASIARLTPEAASEWHARTHRPGNAVLVVHGDHEPDALNERLRATFATGPEALPSAVPAGDDAERETGGAAAATSSPGQASAPTDEPLPPPRYRMPPPARETRELVEPRLSEPELLHSRLASLARRVDPVTLEARLDVLWAVLDSTRPGGLAGPLRFDDFVARGFDLELLADEGRRVELVFRGWPDAGVDNRTLFERFESALLDSARDGIPRETFERVRARLLDDIDESDEPDALVLDLAFELIALGTSPVSLAAYRERLAAVTLDDVDALLRTLADAPRVATLFVEPDRLP